jgi:23S rRNA pseudouridine1911/1915/1917 synthase
VAQAQEALGRQALHAWRLAFTHPRTGKALKLEAPLPEDFEAAVACLREGK